MFYVWRLATGVCCDFTHSFLTTVHIKPAYCTFSRICRATIITLLLFKYFLLSNLIYSQPDSWHQYGPSTQFHYQDTDNAGFVNISPGFFHAKEEVPRLERLTSTEWTESVQKMSSLRDDDSSNSDNIKWHLITSFNEAVEGTIIEATEEWDTNSGMGYFLDALHNN